jgi:hypothetical protein
MHLGASVPAMSTITLSRSGSKPTSLAATSQASAQPTGHWPGDWPSQRQLLERQHGRLEVMLTTLIAEARALGPLASAVAIPSGDLDCQRLQKALGLHLRLEERWLAQWGCLNSGHRASHRRARIAACQVEPCKDTIRLDPTPQLQWLLGLQEWFLIHRDGADAIAYRRADHACLQPHSALLRHSDCQGRPQRHQRPTLGL